MTNNQLDYLDGIANDLIGGNSDRVGVLSTGEKLYVALAASDAAMLARMDYTIAQAIARLGADETDQLVRRWQYVSVGQRNA